MRFFALTAAAVLALAAPSGAAAQEIPDLTGSWKLQMPDSLLMERDDRPPRGGGGMSPAGLPRSGARDSIPLGPARALTITQSDSTVTIGGERLPMHTYFPDGREEKLDFLGVETVVKAWWDGGDLVIERKSSTRTLVESYRLDEIGPRLIVIVEIQPNEESKLRGVRIHRIYDRAG